MPRPKQFHYKLQKDGYYHAEVAGHHIKARTEAELVAKQAAFKRELEQESIIRGNPSVAQYANRWLPVAKAGVSMRSYNECIVHLEHLATCIGGLRVKDVRPSDIKRVYSSCYIGLSDSYIKHARSVFAALFKAAVEDGLIRTNPVLADSARPHRGSTGSHRAITPEERRIIETVAIDHPMHTAAIIMLYAGLRPQEVKALRMEDIDTEIHVRSFVCYSKANRYAETPTGKTKKAARIVPLFPPVAEAIKGKSGLILSGTDGIATPTAWRRSWESYRNEIERALNGVQKRWYGKTKAHKAMIAAGKDLPPWESFSVTPYDLRHSFASWCRDNGVELHTVVDWMGHADASMVLKIYDEVSSARNQSEAEKLKKRAFPSPDALPNE